MTHSTRNSTEQAGTNGTASGWHRQGAGSESRCGNRSNWGFSWFYSITSGQ